MKPATTSHRKTAIRRLLRIAITAAAAAVCALVARSAANATTATQQATPNTLSTRTARTEIRIRIGTRTLSATVAQSKTARDFVSLLPLTLRMSDLFGREKAGPLPRSLASGGKRTYSFSVGDLTYWSPGPDVAVYYGGGGPTIPEPGLILLARLDSGARAFKVPGTVRVRLERAR
jgi:hypothetical protein